MPAAPGAAFGMHRESPNWIYQRQSLDADQLKEPEDPIAPGSHPTAMLLSPDEKLLYVALSNVDKIAVITTSTGVPLDFLVTTASHLEYSGTYPVALAQSADGKRLFADASLNAVGVLDVSDLLVAPNRGTSSREYPSASFPPTGTPAPWPSTATTS